MSVLRPETKEILRGVRDRKPFFNQISAALFEDEHSRGPFKLLPFADGGYVLFDTRRPNGQGVLGGPFEKLEDAHAALLAVAEKGEETR